MVCQVTRTACDQEFIPSDLGLKCLCVARDSTERFVYAGQAGYHLALGCYFRHSLSVVFLLMKHSAQAPQIQQPHSQTAGDGPKGP